MVSNLPGPSPMSGLATILTHNSKTGKQCDSLSDVGLPESTPICIDQFGGAFGVRRRTAHSKGCRQFR